MQSRGIPVRAMLDELTQKVRKSMQWRDSEDQRVRKAKSRIPILTGMTDSAIAVIGERTTRIYLEDSNQ